MEKVVNYVLNTKFLINLLVLGAIASFSLQLVSVVVKVAEQINVFTQFSDIIRMVVMLVLSVVYQPLIFLSFAKIISLMEIKNNAQNK